MPAERMRKEPPQNDHSAAAPFSQMKDDGKYKLTF